MYRIIQIASYKSFLVRPPIKSYHTNFNAKGCYDFPNLHVRISVIIQITSYKSPVK